MEPNSLSVRSVWRASVVGHSLILSLDCWQMVVGSALGENQAELLGALTGEKGIFKKTRRYGWYDGYDLSKYSRFQTSICLGPDKEWGEHISNLVEQCYGSRGSVYFDRNEWRFASSSARLFRDLSLYYDPTWNAHRWRVSRCLFTLSEAPRKRFLRGLFDADGYPRLNPARRVVLVQINSVNFLGLTDVKVLLKSLGYHPGLYRRYKLRDVWELVIARTKEVERFHKEIGFSISRKQSALGQMIQKVGLLK